MSHRFALAALLAVASASAVAQAPSPLAVDDVAGCWCLDVDPWPSPVPDSLAHLNPPDGLPGGLPGRIRLRSDLVPDFPQIPGSYVPEDAHYVDFPEGYRPLPFRYWTLHEGGVRLESTSPSGFRLRLVSAGADGLAGTFTSYASLDWVPDPWPLEEWSVGATLRRTTCEGFPPTDRLPWTVEFRDMRP